ncbi:MAG: helix-turn-helix domain-containing protein [Candidatus Azotimanducaceae bacterium]|uniref:Putative Fis-like DNA-binding protein n=1 Tax=OM182 bacterium TaxID=2510334 RepID=A0A520S3Q1_9GAMM|nr:Fis family transcriptional regulator [Gammaproteobacteria bacterium]OUV67600.1 MAG: hypothetical protein CBC93_04860 [Gammaproteobacteria bacterium TMED133]RZO77066.1 MAG: hypothetical protein EVA68_02315 [OM182 bacterium]
MTVNITNRTLSETVKSAVDDYLELVGDQPVTNLYDLVLAEVEAPLLDCVLRFTGNNQSQTAQILGINRGTLRKKLVRYRLI